MQLKVEIDKDHRIEVPRSVRGELHLRPGDSLIAQVRDGVIILVPDRENAVAQLKGLHREIWEFADAQDYVNKERDEWATS